MLHLSVKCINVPTSSFRERTEFEFGFGLVLGKTWVMVRFILAGFGFFPISIATAR